MKGDWGVFVLRDPRFEHFALWLPNERVLSLDHAKAQAHWEAKEHGHPIEIYLDDRGDEISDPAGLTPDRRLYTAVPRELTSAERSLLEFLHPEWGPMRPAGLTERAAVRSRVHPSHEILFFDHGGQDVVCLGCRTIFNQPSLRNSLQASSICPATARAEAIIETANDEAVYAMWDVIRPPYAGAGWRRARYFYAQRTNFGEPIALARAGLIAQREADAMRRCIAMVVAPSPKEAEQEADPSPCLVGLFFARAEARLHVLPRRERDADGAAHVADPVRLAT